MAFFFFSLIMLTHTNFWEFKIFLLNMYLLENWSESLSVMSDSVTPWTVAGQAALSIGFSRQGHWSGLQFPPPKICIYTSVTLTSFLLCIQFITHSCESERLLVGFFVTPWNFPGQNTGVGSCSLLQGIFPTQGSQIADRFFTSWAIRGTQEYWSG